MYNKRSDYALNKCDHEAIVFASTTGEVIRLTREDFATDAEFDQWKKWSDEDYHAAERRDRAYDDHKHALSPHTDPATESGEAQFFAALKRCEDAANVQRLRSRLTNRQFMRLYKRFWLGMSVTAIATEENVSKAAVMASIRSALDTLRKAVCEDNSADC